MSVSTLDRLDFDSLAGLAQRVDDRIAALLASEAARWSSLGDDVMEPLASLERFVMAGGKRLRPAFSYWAFIGSGGDPDDGRIVDAGAALELLHCFALVHDDVMDASPRRRGRPSVHADYEARHVESGWRGESRRFGEGVAVLVGDLAFVYADLLMAGAPSHAVDVFTELRIEVNMGQYLDLLGTARGGMDEASMRRVCLYKSGKYTVERPLHLGAAMAGRLEDLEAPLSAFGLPLGEAFQLRDDLLGAFGDSGRTGKPVGADIKEGKPTTLYAYAAKAARGKDAQLLTERFGAPDTTEAEVARFQEIFEETGARAGVEARISALVEQAVMAMSGSPLALPAREALIDLAYFVANRDH